MKITVLAGSNDASGRTRRCFFRIGDEWFVADPNGVREAIEGIRLAVKEKYWGDRGQFVKSYPRPDFATVTDVVYHTGNSQIENTNWCDYNVHIQVKFDEIKIQ